MHMALNVPVFGDEGLQIGLSDAHGGAEVMRDEFFLLDPAANTAGRDAKRAGDIVDRVEFCRFVFHCCSIALQSATTLPAHGHGEPFAKRIIAPPRTVATSAVVSMYSIPGSGFRTLDQNWSSLGGAASKGWRARIHLAAGYTVFSNSQSSVSAFA